MLAPLMLLEEDVKSWWSEMRYWVGDWNKRGLWGPMVV